jgi:hypothetical protein
VRKKSIAITISLGTALLLLGPVAQSQAQSIRMKGPAAVGLVPQDTTKPIEPPFGLNWGESEENIIRWIKENNYPSTKGKTKGERSREAIEVEGPFANAEYNRIRFYFGTRGLNEVELQFNELGPPNDKNQEFATFTKSLAIKNKIDSEYGKGILVKNEKGEKEGAEWQFIQQIWTDEEHSIWLAVFVASHPQAATLSMASLHYRWEEDIKPPKKK